MTEAQLMRLEEQRVKVKAPLDETDCAKTTQRERDEKYYYALLDLAAPDLIAEARAAARLRAERNALRREFGDLLARVELTKAGEGEERA